MGCFSGRLMSAASDQELFCKLCSPFCCSFDEFVEEKVISPSYSSAILTPPVNSLVKLNKMSLQKKKYSPLNYYYVWKYVQILFVLNFYFVLEHSPLRMLC